MLTWVAASADRRPVDPPPVVELRIYEGQTWELAQEKDITFVYNANFFLFATLEHARVLAHARGTGSSTNTPPVLTGMPVSGMAYLDRPLEAGYFLFPDLSVRHEGRYKLTFNLYEETKEDKDRDKDCESGGQPAITGLNPATGGSFDFRMEVKSQEFVVYSAKKFPGLAESTALSRVVAEQGCRVRIRRDVRMRRRDGKATGDYDKAADDEYNRRRRTATPDNRGDYNRARSMSGSTERTPYPADSQRRPSVADYPPQYNQNPPSGGHLQFLGGNPTSQYPAAPPPQSYAQPPSVPASPVYPPAQSTTSSSSYQTQSSYPAPPPPPPAAATPRSQSRERTPSQSYASINPPPARRDSVHPEYRPAAPVQLPPLPPQPFHPPTPKQTQMPPPPPTTQAQVLPPIQIDTKNNHGANRLPIPSPTSLTSVSRTLAPLPSLLNPPPSSSKGPLHPSSLPPAPQYAGTKRAHDQSFRREPENSRYQDGAREKGTAEDIADVMYMSFMRADGTKKSASSLPF